MTTINFTNSLGLTTAFTNHDLDLILTELNTHDSSFAAGENQICYIMLNPGHVLLIDLNTINSKYTNPFDYWLEQLKLRREFVAPPPSDTAALPGIIEPPGISREEIYEMFKKICIEKRLYKQIDRDVEESWKNDSRNNANKVLT